MGSLQQHCAGGMATLWLALLLLLAQQQVACGSALPLWPLALELQGRTYELPTGELQRLELPLGCARGALALGVQHRVPALRLQQQCSGVLSVLERSTSGRMISLWSGQQVRGGPRQALAPCIWAGLSWCWV